MSHPLSSAHRLRWSLVRPIVWSLVRPRVRSIGLGSGLILWGSLLFGTQAQACGGGNTTRPSLPTSLLNSPALPQRFEPGQKQFQPMVEPKSSPRSSLAWEGDYAFFESQEIGGSVQNRLYRIRISLLRCGWRAYLTMSGDDTNHTSVDADIRWISDNEIGLYYYGDRYDGRERRQFNRGDLLMRIRSENADTHRIFFEGIEPLMASHRGGFAVDPPMLSR
jgi:hypothetical protein